MQGTRFLLAVIASGAAASLTDWFFMGVLFHGKYLATPEIWRLKPGESETRSILASTVLGVLSCAALILLCSWTGALTTVSGSLQVAILAWLAAPLPVVGMNIIWTKMHPLTGVAHMLGWLARFAITAFFAALLH